MSQLIFPTLPGITWPVQRTVLPAPVVIKTTPSRREFRARDSTVPLYQYTLAFEFLRGASAYQEWQRLVGFYNTVGGQFDDWLFDDVNDNAASNQLFGFGDGVSTVFQLGRVLGSFLEPVYGLNGAPVLTVNDVLNGDFTVSNTGAITFGAPPAAGAALRWTGLFYWRCRFSDESLDLMQNYSTFMEVRKLSFRTVKPL